MDEQTFSILHSALEEINDTNAMEELSSIKDRLDKGNYFVAFIGQYSTGKSTLINNLLDRKVLPGGRVETTPILTYISYNSQETWKISTSQRLWRSLKAIVKVESLTKSSTWKSF